MTDTRSSKFGYFTLRKWRCFFLSEALKKAYGSFECVSMTVCEKLCFEHLPLEYVLLIVYDKHAKLYGHIVLFLFRTFLLHWKRQTLHSICVLNLFFFHFRLHSIDQSCFVFSNNSSYAVALMDYFIDWPSNFQNKYTPFNMCAFFSLLSDAYMIQLV